MSNYALPSGAVSKRFLITTYGFNLKHLRTLLDLGVLRTLGHGIDEASLENLREGEHYVVCLECAARQAIITPRHLKMCSGLDLDEYKAKHHGSPVISSVTVKAKAKSEAQKQKQSETLKARFRTPLGEVTRQQISEASKKLMQTEYKSKAASHLRRYVREHREVFVKSSRRMWEDPEFRLRMAEVHRERDRRLGTTTHARGFITRTFSKPHRIFEAALVEAGVEGLQREFLVGYYRVDEALPDSKIAIEVDGCYWHGCSECGHLGHPYTLKLDQRKTTYLLNRGWKVVRVSEHMVLKDLQGAVRKVVEAINGSTD
jgi:very-short-patch-repair endonuclease